MLLDNPKEFYVTHKKSMILSTLSNNSVFSLDYNQVTMFHVLYIIHFFSYFSSLNCMSDTSMKNIFY